MIISFCVFNFKNVNKSFPFQKAVIDPRGAADVTGSYHKY